MPVVEVIRPAVRRAAAATRNDRVGVISTRGTHQSGAYADAFAAAPHVQVTSQPCPRFVEFVEAGVTGGPGAARRGPRVPRRRSQARGVDTLILGCTHYPLLTGVISYVMGDGVTLVSSAEETAKDVFRVLADADALRPDHLPRARPRVPHHRRPRRVRPAGAPLPRARGGRGAPRSGGDGVRLTVVGCSGSFAGPDSPASSYLVRAEHEGRTGQPAARPRQRRARRAAAAHRPSDLDAVMVSHLHPDHCVDLLGLYVTRKYQPSGPPPEPAAGLRPRGHRRSAADARLPGTRGRRARQASSPSTTSSTSRR